MKKCLIGVPKELKEKEGRVGITPEGVRTLRSLEIDVAVEQGAGACSGFSDGDYISSGAMLYHKVEDIYHDADLIVKVKEPIPQEYPLLPLLAGKAIFTYLHLAGSDPELTKLLLRHEVNAIAYENVMREIDGRTTFPLLVPMSRIAGVEAMRGALLRHKKDDHRELKVVILGGGVVGESALTEALANEVASVAVFELREERRAELETLYRAHSTASFFPFFALDTYGKAQLNTADVIIAATLTPGGAVAPIVLTQKHFRRMKCGAYIVDVAIDQGGSTAWSKVTKPGETFTRGKNKLVFSCVPNIPGSTVPAQATKALVEETLPFVGMLGASILLHGRNTGLYWALKEHPDLRAGLQTFRGFLVNSFVSSKHQLFSSYRPKDHFF